MSEIADLLAHRDRTRERHATARALLLCLLEHEELLGRPLFVPLAAIEVRTCVRELATTERAIALRCAGVGAVRGLS